MSAIAKGISKLFKPSKVRKKATSTPTRKKSPATVAREMRQKATMGNKKALKGLQLEAQRKAKDAKRGVDKKKQDELKKKMLQKPASKTVKRRFGGAIRRAGQALAGNKKSAKRKNEDGKSVRMSKDNSSGLMNEVASGKGAGKQASPAAQKVRKGEGRAASDLNQPAMRSLGKTADAADSKIPDYKRVAFTGQQQSKNLTKTMKDLEAAKKKLESYNKKRDSLKGIDKTKFIAKQSKKITKDKENIKLLKSKIKDMKRRDIVPKKNGGKIINKNMGGPLKAVNNPGLAKLARPVRNKMGFAKAGGKVKGYKKGGPITYRMSGGQVVDNSYD